jgi:hypothetical protein
VNSDELDADFTEIRILESIPRLPVTKGFYAKCQDLFDNWPTIGRLYMREHDSKPDTDEDGWEHATARSCSTYELEGRDTLWLQILRLFVAKSERQRVIKDISQD